MYYSSKENNKFVVKVIRTIKAVNIEFFSSVVNKSMPYHSSQNVS